MAAGHSGIVQVEPSFDSPRARKVSASTASRPTAPFAMQSVDAVWVCSVGSLVASFFSASSFTVVAGICPGRPAGPVNGQVVVRPAESVMSTSTVADSPGISWGRASARSTTTLPPVRARSRSRQL